MSKSSAAAIQSPQNTEKWVYTFGGSATEGHAGMKNLLGGKGANLAEMCSIGLPVPPGFTLTTDICGFFYANGRSYPAALAAEVDSALGHIETVIGRRFGDAANPLLLSVRSGARASMPGMMDTVLNLGLNDESVEGLAKASGNARFAYDSYRRFLHMFGDVVLGVSHDLFEDALETYKRRNGFAADTDLGAEDWQAIVADYKSIIRTHTGTDFPQDAKTQLWAAIGAVFTSWMTPRAVTYRKLNDIPESWGTAVNVQAMVFGNMGDDCATGVAFTRDPSTGENVFYGEYLINAQGEDVVAGIRTPHPIADLAHKMPQAHAELLAVRDTLEKHYRDMQDIEFTIEKNVLYMLQTRAGKRTAKAALKCAFDMVNEGLIDKNEALLRIAPESLDQLLHPSLDPKADKTRFARGLPASPGAVNGRIVFSADDAEHVAKDGTSVILCRIETSPEDIHGMHAAKGILTARGGMTSHAAVVARGMGRPCVAGAGDISIDYAAGRMQAGGVTLNMGDIVTIDGGTGEIFIGSVPTVPAALNDDFETVMAWADQARRMRVRANAETEADAKTARRFGAEGIGLCRTEHMFFDETRIFNVRRMILSQTDTERDAALAALEPEQTEDFKAIFRAMSGLPVTVRLLDPPLHEFLPHSAADIAAFAERSGMDRNELDRRISRLHEANPMLGHRGCRLGVTFPAIYEMQVRAIITAAAALSKDGIESAPEIMIPLVAWKTELDRMTALVRTTADECIARLGGEVNYTVGTMIELPRAALRADEIAQTAQFFSFGTNDLTQTTLGLSRDDAGNFLPHYVDNGIVPNDPFVSIDVDGVGELVRTACARGRSASPDLKLGVCGEHGGDAKSIAFFEEAGLDYVSCSPFRVPVARLAAAQAFIRTSSKT